MESMLTEVRELLRVELNRSSSILFTKPAILASSEGSLNTLEHSVKSTLPRFVNPTRGGSTHNG